MPGKLTLALGRISVTGCQIKHNWTSTSMRPSCSEGIQLLGAGKVKGSAGTFCHFVLSMEVTGCALNHALPPCPHILTEAGTLELVHQLKGMGRTENGQ